MPEQPREALSPLQTSEKQRALLEVCRKFKFVLASGPRLAGKTQSAEIAILDHAWRIPAANIVLVCISQSAGVDSGVWQELVEFTLPRYMELTGMKWVRRPYNANPSKKPTFLVSNAYGGFAKIQLDSLPNEDEVEKRFKGKSYSMIYVSELSNFKRQKTFDIWALALRGAAWKDEDFLFLGDTNPAEEGEQSWIYKRWWDLRQATPEQIQNEYPDNSAKVMLAMQKQLAVVEFGLYDNPFISQARIDEVIGLYAHDQDLTDRYVHGLWIAASTDCLFSEQFRESKHVGGEIETPTNRTPLILCPQPSSIMLGTGWDFGSGTNSAALIIDEWWRVLPNGRRVLSFVFLDELVVVGRSHTLPDFKQDFQDKMRWWETLMGRPYEWDHRSDRSVFDQREPVENRTYHMLVCDASDGEIVLKAADRSPGSHVRRVDFFRRLLHEDRILINRDLCPTMVRMCKSIKAARGTPHPQAPGARVAKGDRHKHVFDAAMYYIESKCAEELQQTTLENYIKKNRPQTSGIVAVAA